MCVRQRTSVRKRKADKEEVADPLQHRERTPCHNLCLKKHEFFSAQRQRWHFMFTTIISLVNDSCGCGTYESFREQTETLMLRVLSSFAGCNFNGVSESGTNSEVSMGIMISVFHFRSTFGSRDYNTCSFLIFLILHLEI